MAKPRAPKSPPKKTLLPATPAPIGERDQLASLRADFPPLSSTLAGRLLAQHDDATCHTRGTSTRAGDTFRGAMGWARTLHTHRDALAPVLDPRRVRWFLDCLSHLGDAIEGRPDGINPSAAAVLDDAQRAARSAYTEAVRRLQLAIGSNAQWRGQLDAKLSLNTGTSPDVERLRALATYVSSLTQDPSGPPVELHGLDAAFIASLEDAATALAAALAAKPAPRQIDRDSSPVNVAEGRLFFVMRGLWDDLQAARDARKTDILLNVSPSLLRGLGLSPVGAKTPKV